MIITNIVIFICLILSAFFSGMEIAYVSANKIYLEIEKQQSSLNAKLLNFITKNPSRFIATMLVGNNISLAKSQRRLHHPLPAESSAQLKKIATLIASAACRDVAAA